MRPIDLGDGFVLRRSTSADTEAIADFYVKVFKPLDGAMDTPMRQWVYDLMCGDHPTFSPGDFTVVMRGNEIVSGTCLIDQTWTYEGIPFGVGRPELVATLPEYRNKGLIRRQFDVIHAWSAERGQKMQAITGIRYYYRQFGYEMAVRLQGGRGGYHAPVLNEGETEPYRVRPATEVDIPLLVELSVQHDSRGPLASPYDATLWRYCIDGRSKDSDEYFETRVIETADGEAIGYLSHNARPNHNAIYLIGYELLPGTPWYAVTPSVARYLMSAAQRIRPKATDYFGLALVPGHPAYDVLEDTVLEEHRPYAWYIRIPDLADFLRHITPALETRLAASPMIGYSGELTLNFFRNGVRLVFEKGRIVTVDTWQPSASRDGSAAFPDLTFLHLLMGHRSLDDLLYAYPDSIARGHAKMLLKSLFPMRPSNVWGVA